MPSNCIMSSPINISKPFCHHLPENKVLELQQKMRRTSTPSYIVNGEQLIQRRCILEGVKEMYSAYLIFKWQEVQSCIKSITNASTDQSLEEEVFSDQDDEDDDVDFQDFIDDDGDSEEEADSDIQDDIYISGSSCYIDTFTRALCADSCELHRHS